MAGGHSSHSPVKLDRGVESWSYMRENVYKTFKFTPRTTGLSIIWAFAVPLIAYYGIAAQNLRWDWQGKKRSDSLLLQFESDK